MIAKEKGIVFEEINLEYIENHAFEDVQSEMKIEKDHRAYRFTKGDLIAPSDEQKATLLRKKLSELIFTKFDGNYAKLESSCAINKDNVMKFVNQGKRGRDNVSRSVLGKFCVGAGLSVEEAQELFILQGYALDPFNKLFDSIVVCCLKKKDDIYEMIDMCQKHNVVIDRSAS